MDEFEKVNGTLENEQPDAEAETEVLSQENVEVTDTAETESEAAAADSGEETEMSEYNSENTEEPVESIAEYDYSVDSTAVGKTKKTMIIQRTIIIAACILLAALLAFGGFILVKNITTPSLEGVWVMTKAYVKGNEKSAQKSKTSGKEATYYNFKSDGNFVYTSGTVKQTLKWSYVDGNKKKTSEKTKKISIYQAGSESSGQIYSIDLEGGLFAEKKLKIEVSTDLGMGATSVQVMELKAYDGSEAPEYKMKPDKNFKPVNELLGTWNDPKTKQKITLNKDGSYVLNVSGNLEQTGNYTVDTKKKTVSLSYVSSGQEAKTGDLPYKIKGDKLTLSNYEFTKVK